jgi:hypothetical protein
MKPLSVECTFTADGRVQIRRIKIDTDWLSIEQGRQWADNSGRHVLIQLQGSVRQLTLQPDTLIWHIKNLSSSHVAL